MADDRIALHELLEARIAANRLMESEIKVCGAGYGERTERRRDWETRAGSVELPIPKLWRDNQFPGSSSRPGPQKRRLTVVIGSQRSWEWQHRWFGATYVKVRRDHRIGSIATIVAVGMYTDGRREVLSMTAGDSRDDGHGVGPPGLRQSSPRQLIWSAWIQHFSAFSTGYTMRVAAADDFSAVARIFSAVISS